MSRHQSTSRRNGAAFLRFPDLQKASLHDFSAEKIAIFVHGFTADSSYMLDLMAQFDAGGFKCLSFEYPSDRGIDNAAKQLKELLTSFDLSNSFADKKITLVGHSMGGLVCRAFVLFEGGQEFTQTVITLGSPHQGTLKNAKIVQLLLDWGESVSSVNPWGYHPESRSGRQLMLADQDENKEPYLIRLGEAKVVKEVFFYTFSGGKNYLEFGRNPVKNMLANAYLARQLSTPNDGLVEERSAKLTANEAKHGKLTCKHHCDYIDYSQTNHSHLIRSQIVALVALRCTGFAWGNSEQELILGRSDV